MTAHVPLFLPGSFSFACTVLAFYCKERSSTLHKDICDVFKSMICPFMISDLHIHMVSVGKILNSDKIEEGETVTVTADHQGLTQHRC